MKSTLIILIFFLFIVSGFSQTRNVVVGTNDVIVQPTNFWSANASNALSGLGLGTAATNPASAFQPSSFVLSNLASSNGSLLTNIPVASVVGALATNGSAAGLTNFPASVLSTNGNAIGLTNFPANLLRTNGSALGLTGFPAEVYALSNATGVLAVEKGGTGATNAGGSRTNFGLGWTALTNTSAGPFLNALGFDSAIVIGGAADATLEIINDEQDTINVGFSSSNGGSSTVSFFTNAITINGNINFTTITQKAVARTNLGLVWTGLTNTNASGFRSALDLSAAWLTNTNAANFRSDIGLGWSALTNSNAGTGFVSVNTNGEVVSPTNFWQVSPANTRVQLSQPVVNATNSATNARNLFLYSLAISTTGVTNTIQLPTNGGTLLGDVATVIHEGPTSSITAVRQIGAGTNIITLNQFQEAVKFIYETSGWRLADNLSFVEAIYFSGTNAAANAAASRTNLGLGNSSSPEFASLLLSDLSNTNAVDYAVFVDDTGSFYSTSVGSARTNLGLGAFKNPNNYAELLDASGQTILDVEDGVSVFRAISWQGTNNETYKADTRTNLGLGWSALTNTNAAGFQRAIFSTNAAPTNSANINTVNFNTAVAWIEISVVTNSVTNSYRIPVFQ